MHKQTPSMDFLISCWGDIRKSSLSSCEPVGYFENMFQVATSTHPHNTRYKDVPRITLPVRNSTKFTIRFYIPALINEIPANIMEKIFTHSYSGFSKYTKLQFIDKYSEVCTITNCYTCNLN